MEDIEITRQQEKAGGDPRNEVLINANTLWLVPRIRGPVVGVTGVMIRGTTYF